MINQESLCVCGVKFQVSIFLFRVMSCCGVMDFIMQIGTLENKSWTFMTRLWFTLNVWGCLRYYILMEGCWVREFKFLCQIKSNSLMNLHLHLRCLYCFMGTSAELLFCGLHLPLTGVRFTALFVCRRFYQSIHRSNLYATFHMLKWQANVINEAADDKSEMIKTLKHLPFYQLLRAN